MTEQMEERMNEQRLRDAAELERCIRQTEDKLIDLRTQQAALLAGQDPAVQTVADEEWNPGYTSGASLAHDDLAAREDFENQPDPYEMA